MPGPIGESRSKTRTPEKIADEIRSRLGDEPWWGEFTDEQMVRFLIGQDWPWKGPKSLLTEYGWAKFVHVYLPAHVEIEGIEDLTPGIAALLE